ncbi:hypothetical protein EVAR_13703_1 [Eumeta japonica]|uniref:Ig-like domain-containing protein n=1 Tax=Eumeta variegata TaxID=151549 RepID=A0A4C1UC95_EUMVA|nr:hypothetical protein EVAR_13703_1 [Eumeta japonica]
MELNDGRCTMTLPNATKQDSGTWKCYIGKKTVGAEIITKISVRVADRFAAVEPLTTATYGKQVTLLCTTTKTMVPLTYCRFEPPSGDAFSINADITSHQPILEKYFFPQNKSLDRGDCAVTIKKVKYDDVGNWTCGAGLEDDGKVYSDVIKLEVEGLRKMSTAATTGITFSVISIVIIIGTVAFIFWKKHKIQQSSREEREQYEISPQDPQGGNIPLVVVQSPSEPSASSIQLST